MVVSGHLVVACGDRMVVEGSFTLVATRAQ